MIESWLVADGAKPRPDSSSGVYGGETVSISTIKPPPPRGKAPRTGQAPRAPSRRPHRPQPRPRMTT